MKEIKKLIPYLIITIITFYLIPFFMLKNTSYAILCMIIILPLICFITSIIYGIKNSFKWYYPLLVAILFIPTIFIFYNHTATPYVIGYGIITLIGNLIGMIFYQKKK